MGDMHVERLDVPLRRKAQIGAQPGEAQGELRGGADRRGRFEDHHVAAGEHRRDRVRRRLDIAEIGRAVVVERGRHRDHEGIGRLRPGGGAQLAERGRGPQQHVEIGLGEIGLAGIDRGDHARVDVDPDHLDPAAG